jgi:hypothetical protein
MTHKISQEHFKERAKSKEPTDGHLLHGVAKIIQNDIAKVEFSTEHQRMHLSVIHFILCPIKLLKWVTNDKAFNADDNPPGMQIDGLKKCLELIECIVAISWIMFSRFHVYIAIYREFD